MAQSGNEAFVTLATNDTYVVGSLVLGESLRRVGTQKKLVVMITKEVSEAFRNNLQNVFDDVHVVDLLSSEDFKNLQLLGRPDLHVTFTKLHCWNLTQYSKCVFLDADTLVLQNVDELFEKEELSAAPDPGWPDCFNSGVFVYTPNVETYKSLMRFASTQGTFDGGDQGLLNLYFNEWPTKDIKKHLPFIYNVVSQAFYSYLPAFRQFKQNVKIVHFIGAIKPWQHPYSSSTRTVTPLPHSGHDAEFLQRWWDIFTSSVQPKFDPSAHLDSMPEGLIGQLASLGFDHDGNRAAMDDFQKRMAWEHGNIDYMGQDSFENIQRKLDSKMNVSKETAD